MKARQQTGGHFTAEERRNLLQTSQDVSALLSASTSLVRAQEALSTLDEMRSLVTDALESPEDKAGAEALLRDFANTLQIASTPRVPSPRQGARLSQAPHVVPPLPAEEAPQAGQAMRDSIAEVMRLNAMYFAFFDMADGRLDALEQALPQSTQTRQAPVEAYPPHVCALFKEGHLKFRRCRASAMLYRAMLSEDRKLVQSQRSQLRAYVDSLQICTPHLQDGDLATILSGSYERMNSFMTLIAKDLLCEGLQTYWCVDLRSENRRLLPYIVGRQLDLLDPFVADDARLQRVRIPNLDHVVDATVQRRPKRVSTLATSIAAVGAEVLEEQSIKQAEVAARSAANKPDRNSPRATQLASDDARSGDASAGTASSDEEAYFDPRHPPRTPDLPRIKPTHTPRRLRVAKQAAPQGAPSTVCPPSSTAAAAPGPSLHRHKAKQRPRTSGAGPTQAAWELAASSGAEASVLQDAPQPQFSKRGADTLRRLMAPSYTEKVKKREYQQLLNEFVLLNGPSDEGPGYLQRVRQTCNAASAQATGPLRFNGQSESIWFQRYDDTWVMHSFHYPHDRDGTVELPRGMLHDYRNVFRAFGISG